MSALLERFAELRPFVEMETQLARCAVQARGGLDARDEALLRMALALCRLWIAPGELTVAPLLRPHRERVLQRLFPLLDPQRASLATSGDLGRAAADLAVAVHGARADLRRRTEGAAAWEDVERELSTPKLVLVCGGGGGTGYVHLAAFALLESAGLQPALLAGSSMGAVLGLFRAREKRFDLARIPEILADLSYRKLFRLGPQPSVYGFPGPLRLQLRAAVGHWFRDPDGAPLRLCDLPIPLLVTVGGLRRGKLPRPLEWYDRLVPLEDPEAGPRALYRGIHRFTEVIAELTRVPRLLRSVVFGATAGTREADALDAAGFSASVPALIHYDVLRDDPRMKALLDGLLEHHGLLRLCDGGVVDNVPVRTTWQHIQRTGVGAERSRNAVILALDGFAPRLATPLWLPLQSVAAPATARNRPYAHLFKSYRRTLSPLALLPSTRALESIVRSAKEELLPEIPVLQRLLAGIPPLPE